MPSNAGRDGVDPDSRTRRQPRGLPASSMCRSATQARICIYQARLKCSLTNVGPARPSGHRLRECGPFNTGDGRAMGIRAASTRASGIPATEHRLRVTSNAVGTGLRTTWGTDVSCLGSTDTELASAIAQLTYSADSVAQQHVNAITSGSDRFDTSPVDSRHRARRWRAGALGEQLRGELQQLVSAATIRTGHSVHPVGRRG